MLKNKAKLREISQVYRSKIDILAKTMGMMIGSTYYGNTDLYLYNSKFDIVMHDQAEKIEQYLIKLSKLKVFL